MAFTIDMDAIHTAMIEAVAFHTNKPAHQLRTIPHYEDQMRVAARAAAQEIAEQFGRAAGKDVSVLGEDFKAVSYFLTNACLREQK